MSGRGKLSVVCVLREEVGALHEEAHGGLTPGLRPAQNRSEDQSTTRSSGPAEDCRLVRARQGPGLYVKIRRETWYEHLGLSHS